MIRCGVLLAPEAASSGLVVGGLSVLERQARLLRRAGCAPLLLVDPAPLTPLPDDVEILTAQGLAARLKGFAGEAVVIAPGLVIDERCLAELLATPGPSLLESDGSSSGMAGSDRSGVERLDSTSFAAGLMRLPAAMVADVAANLGDWELGSTLIRMAAADAAVERVPMAAIARYAPARRRSVPLLWARPEDSEQAARASEAVVASAQKGCLDWPARFIHPWIENPLVKLLAPTPVTPNMVTLFTAFIGIGAGYALATGALWWGLGLALLCGPLDGVDGKLARTRIEYSRWGDLEHVIDKIVEYGWYLAAASWFAAVQGSGLAWAVAALIILPALVEAVQGEFYRRLTGAQLDDAGPFERRVRLVAGRRNTFLWTWLGFALLGLWFEGFVALAVYSILTTGVAQWRFYKRLGAYARAGDARAAANFAATSYGFLATASLPRDRL